MSAGEEIRKERIKKLEKLAENKINPYPAKVAFALTEIASAKLNFKKLATKNPKPIGIAGRILAKRGHGGIMFLDIFDGSNSLGGSTAKLQVFAAEDKMGKENYSLLQETIDVGDFVAVWGKPFYTKRKEPTIEAEKWQMLSKSLRPLPEKWHGLVDVEERFRKRYLDILMNGQVKEKAVVRSKIVSALRSFLDSEGFLEVETPVLQTLAGGTSARPFKTHHNALDIDLNLRIALEIHLKQLLVGGLPKVYEMGRIFRNEGIDATHNPEFTMLEAYAAYWDEEQLMKFIEKLTGELAKTVSKNKAIVFGENKISFKPPFKRINFFDALERYAMIMDYGKKSRDEIVTIALRFGLNPEPHDSKGKIADKIFAKVCRPKLINPTFVMNYPVEIFPLAKRSEKNPGMVIAFQLIAGGIELVKAFNELNDPIDQRERFKKELENKEKGDYEAQPMDEEFIEALEYGMPPAAGFGIGIDRLVMLLTNTDNVKEIILFPTMKPRQ